MDSLPDWAVSIIAIAVGLSPGLAILSGRRIAWLLHRALWPRSERAPPTRLITRAPNTAYVGLWTRPRSGAPCAAGIAVYRISRVFVCCPTAMYTNPR
jgi:hypothetical protein